MAGRTNTALPFYCIKFYGNPLSPCFVSSMPYLLMPVKAFSLGFKWDAGALSDYAPGIYSVPQPRPFRYSVPQPVPSGHSQGYYCCALSSSAAAFNASAGVCDPSTNTLYITVLLTRSWAATESSAFTGEGHPSMYSPMILKNDSL